MGIENPQLNKNEVKERFFEEVNLKDLKIGDKIVVQTGKENKRIYEITLIGRKRGSAIVKLKITEYSIQNPEEKKVKELTARMPGGFEMNKIGDAPGDRIVTKEGRGLVKDKIKIGGENTLYFENVKTLDGGPYSGKIRTEPISEILKINKQEQADKKND